MKNIKYLTWFLFIVFLYFYLHLFQNALIDDAFITLRYVKTLITSGTWGFFPGHIANSATSPLNVLLLTVVSLFMGATVEAVMWLTLLCLVFTAISLTRVSLQLTGTETFGWLAVSALVFNPLLMSTIGLESILFIALFAASVYCCQVQRWNLLALSLGLLTMTRAEGALFFLVFLIFIPTTKIKMRFALMFLLCTLPWYIFSWVELGSFVPDTFFIKTDQGSWWQWDYFNGMATLYYHAYPLETILSFVFLPLLTMLFNRKYAGVKILSIIGLAGLVHFIGYSLLRVPPFHWYYVPLDTVIILLGSFGLGVVYQKNNLIWQKGTLAFVTAIYFLIPMLGMFHILARDNFTVKEVPIHSNWATHEQYKAIGLWLKEEYGGETIRLVAGEIGTMAYYCDCRLLDRFSDRGWMQDYIVSLSSDSGITPVLYRINFMFYSAPKFPPDTYVLRAYTGEPDNQFEVIKKMQTSTKWIPQGFVILNRR